MRKRFNLKIIHKLAISFGIVLISIIGSYYAIYNMLIKNIVTTEKVGKEILPSLSAVNKLNLTLLDSKIFLQHWLHTNSDTSDIKKKKFLKIISDYPVKKKAVTDLSVNMENANRKILINTISNIDLLFTNYKNLTRKLNKPGKYSDSLLIDSLRIEFSENSKLMKIIDNSFSVLDKFRKKFKLALLNSNTEMEESFSSFGSRLMMSGIILSFLILIISFLLIPSIINPINYLRKQIVSMSTGELPKHNIRISGDETGQIGYALNELIQGLKEKAEFAVEIGKANFDKEIKLSGKKDLLGNSLLKMRESLVSASKEAELRRVENQQRGWASQGYAEFNEIVREHSSTLEKFTSVTISKLTKYLDAQVGVLYIANEEEGTDVYLTMEAFYAYGRLKYIEKRIELGESLVGQSFLEKDTIYMTDIPKNYVHISSGLGEDDPKSILIVPLMLNRKVYGIAEIASFNEIEPYQIEFVEKTGEILASTIANIKINLQTSKLLKDSTEKSKLFSKQKEESSKKIKDLESNNEELTEKYKEQTDKYKRVENEYKNTINSLTKKLKLRQDEIKNQSDTIEKNLQILNNSLSIIETDMRGVIQKANVAFVKMSKIPMVDIIGKTIYSIVGKEQAQSKKYIEDWQNIRHGTVINREIKYFFKGEEKRILETLTPIKDADNNYTKVVIASIDITEI